MSREQPAGKCSRRGTQGEGGLLGQARCAHVDEIGQIALDRCAPLLAEREGVFTQDQQPRGGDLDAEGQLPDGTALTHLPAHDQQGRDHDQREQAAPDGLLQEVP